MSIELKENDRVHGFWFLDLYDPDRVHIGNWMAVMIREEGGRLRLNYRFRWFEDNKIFDSADRRSFWEATLPPSHSLAQHAKIVDGLVEQMKSPPKDIGTVKITKRVISETGIDQDEFLRMIVEAGIGEARCEAKAKA